MGAGGTHDDRMLLQTSVVVFQPRGSIHCSDIGCTAEIMMLTWQPDGSCHGVARGLQRIAIGDSSGPREPSR